MSRLLVTGGAGFIGSSFIKHYLSFHPQDAILNLDKLTYAGNLRNLEEVRANPNYEFVQGDIADQSLVRRILKGVDFVINFAAETHVDRSIKDPSSFVHTNYVGVHNLLEKARESRVKRFVQISTDEVYGSREKGSFREEDTLHPSSPYSASKGAADLLVLSYGVTYGLPALVIRSSNNFGPYQYPEKVIPLFITNLMEGKKVPLYSRGENVRDWLFVGDNCRAIDLVLQRGCAGEVYNVGGGCEMTNRELTRSILTAFGKGEEWIEYVSDRPGHDFRYSIDSSKVKHLGFTPEYDFARGLEHTVAWYRKRQDWWQPLKTDEFTLK